jgi:hypothetical protein
MYILSLKYICTLYILSLKYKCTCVYSKNLPTYLTTIRNIGIKQELFVKYKIEMPLDFAKKLTLEEIFQVLDKLCDTGIKIGTRSGLEILAYTQEKSCIHKKCLSKCAQCICTYRRGLVKVPVSHLLHLGSLYFTGKFFMINFLKC